MNRTIEKRDNRQQKPQIHEVRKQKNAAVMIHRLTGEATEAIWSSPAPMSDCRGSTADSSFRLVLSSMLRNVSSSSSLFFLSLCSYRSTEEEEFVLCVDISLYREIFHRLFHWILFSFIFLSIFSFFFLNLIYWLLLLFVSLHYITHCLFFPIITLCLFGIVFVVQFFKLFGLCGLVYT